MGAKQFLQPRPSSYTQDYWIHEAGPPSRTPRPGKWMVFVPRSLVDVWWDRIRHDVNRGRLGPSAKVSTALSNPLATGPDHVIIVYTADADDVDDVMRVRDHLRRLGIDWLLHYKEDAATHAGHYGEPNESARYSK